MGRVWTLACFMVAPRRVVSSHWYWALPLIYAISERIFGVVKKLDQDHESVNAPRRAGIGPEPGERIAQEDESLAFAGREQAGGLQDRGQLRPMFATTSNRAKGQHFSLLQDRGQLRPCSRPGPSSQLGGSIVSPSHPACPSWRKRRRPLVKPIRAPSRNFNPRVVEGGKCSDLVEPIRASSPARIPVESLDPG